MASSSSRTPPKPRQLRPLPALDEADLEETWVRGSGPGGQSINKTNISCSLIHKPTGIRVQNHETRSRMLNAKLARRRLQEKLDMLYNPGSSRLEQKWDRERRKKAAKARKTRRKHDAKAGEREQDDHDDESSTDLVRVLEDVRLDDSLELANRVGTEGSHATAPARALDDSVDDVKDASQDRSIRDEQNRQG